MHSMAAHVCPWSTATCLGTALVTPTTRATASSCTPVRAVVRCGRWSCRTRRSGVCGAVSEPAAGATALPQDQRVHADTPLHARNGNGARAPLSQGDKTNEAEDVPHCTDDDVLIELVNVHKSFGSRKVLAGANLVVRRGEAVGIIGPSGTGKSTILRIMAGLLEPDEGHVFIRGRRRKGLIGDETKERLRIGMVFQSAAMFDSLTVVENVGFTLYEHSKLPDARIRELVTESLTRVGLSGVEDRYPSQLSGGMKKRAALARAIIVDPTSEDKGVEEVVMYDEPTAGLDPIASTVVEDLMRDLHKKSTGTASSGGISSYIVVTHQHSTIRRATDRLVFLHQGVVVWQGSASEFDTSEEPIVRQFARGELNGPITY